MLARFWWTLLLAAAWAQEDLIDDTDSDLILNKRLEDDIVLPLQDTEDAGDITLQSRADLPEDNDLNASVEEEQQIIEETKPHQNVQPDGIVVVDTIGHPFSEELILKPLAKNHLLSSFKFEIGSSEFVPNEKSQDFNHYSHYTVFPRSLSSILKATKTRQLHLRFNRGSWDSSAWGKLPHDGFESGGSGVEVLSAIESDSKDNTYGEWKRLVNTLSGMFCSSLNFIDTTKTTYPISSFQPDTIPPIFDSANDLYLVRGALANEPICTENLTPLIKLLPTKGKAGISTLLDGHKIFDSKWHSFAIDIDTVCDPIRNVCKYKMVINLDVVMHVPTALARKDRPIPKPLTGETLRCDLSKPHDEYQCFPLPPETEVTYELSDLFGRSISGSSLISSNPSKICMDAPSNWKFFINIEDKFFSTDSKCFSLEADKVQDFHIESDDTTIVTNTNSDEYVPIFVSRSLTGYRQDRGGLRTVFKNTHNETIKLNYFESLPWFMRFYLSSMVIENQDGEILKQQDYIDNIYYIPAIDRKRPAHLEYGITIPPNSVIIISYQFDKSLLHFAEYLPDANHGFEIESAVITIVSPKPYQLRTSTLLLLLSTPDFSMPYNVIILTSTIMCLIFGTLFNFLVKRTVPLDVADKYNALYSPQAKLQSIKNNILKKLPIKKRQ